MMDALTKQWKINSVGSMGLRAIITNVAIKVVPIIQGLGEEGFALNMVQKLRSRFATMTDVPTKLSETMFVCGMEESERGGIFVDIKDVPTELLTEEFAQDMELKSNDRINMFV